MQKRRIILPLVYVLFAVLAIHFLVPEFSSMKAAGHAITRLRGYWVLAALGAQVLSYVGSGGLIRAAVGLSGESASIGFGILVTLAANGVGTLGGGFIGTAMSSYRWAKNRGISKGSATVSGWLPPFINNCVLIALSNWGLLVLLFRHQLSGVMLGVVAVLETLMAGALVALGWTMGHPKQAKGLARRAGAWWRHKWHKHSIRNAGNSTIDQLFSSLRHLSRGNWIKPLMWSLMNVGFDCATLYLLFSAARQSTSLGVILAGYALPQLLGKALMLPGGLGAVEASMIGLYATLGVPRSVGVVVVLSYRVLSFWIPTLLGLAAVPYLESEK